MLAQHVLRLYFCRSELLQKNKIIDCSDLIVFYSKWWIGFPFRIQQAPLLKRKPIFFCCGRGKIHPSRDCHDCIFFPALVRPHSYSTDPFDFNSTNAPPKFNIAGSPWKMVVGRLPSYWEGNFSGAMLHIQGVPRKIVLNLLLSLSINIYIYTQYLSLLISFSQM